MWSNWPRSRNTSAYFSPLHVFIDLLGSVSKFLTFWISVLFHLIHSMLYSETYNHFFLIIIFCISRYT